MDKLRKTIIRCTGFLCAAVFLANGFIILPIASLIIGFIARLIGKKLVFLKDMIFPESVSAENENEAKEQTAGTYGKNVIAIGRQFGSGGHDIGKILAEKLGYDFYDAEIIQMTARLRTT